MARADPDMLGRKMTNDLALQEMPGMICVVDLEGVPAGLDTILHNNGMTPHKNPPRALPSEIEYVVFITKENHTFDGSSAASPARRARANMPSSE